MLPAPEGLINVRGEAAVVQLTIVVVDDKGRSMTVLAQLWVVNGGTVGGFGAGRDFPPTSINFKSNILLW